MLENVEDLGPSSYKHRNLDKIQSVFSYKARAEQRAAGRLMIWVPENSEIFILCQPVSQPVRQATTQPASQLSSHPDSYPDRQTVTHPPSHPAIYPPSYPVTHPPTQPATHPPSYTASQPASYLATHPATSHPATHPVSQISSCPPGKEDKWCTTGQKGRSRAEKTVWASGGASREAPQKLFSSMIISVST